MALIPPLVQNIALSPSELGDLVETINGGQGGKSIYHDPNKGRTGWGSHVILHALTPLVS